MDYQRGLLGIIRPRRTPLRLTLRFPAHDGDRLLQRSGPKSAFPVITCAGFATCDSSADHSCSSEDSAVMNLPSRLTGIPSRAHRCAVAAPGPKYLAMATHPFKMVGALRCGVFFAIPRTVQLIGPAIGTFQEHSDRR